jgi:hypothetical protein
LADVDGRQENRKLLALNWLTHSFNPQKSTLYTTIVNFSTLSRKTVRK